MAALEKPLAFVDVDVDDAQAKFARASHFVESCDLKYSLSSKDVRALGGRELRSLPELYANDFDWAQKGPMRARPQPRDAAPANPRSSAKRRSSRRSTPTSPSIAPARVGRRPMSRLVGRQLATPPRPGSRPRAYLPLERAHQRRA